MDSKSEQRALQCLHDGDLNIYCVGVSTAGRAELAMARQNPKRKIIATTIDERGRESVAELFSKLGLLDRVDVKLEDVSQPLPYPPNFFDFSYARLVLHYLNREQLCHALKELQRVLKPGGRLFVVVRSDECEEAKCFGAIRCVDSGLTTYPSPLDGSLIRRFFHSEESICRFVKEAGFSVLSCSSYRERLCMDFQRTLPAETEEPLIELIARKM